MRRTFHCHGLEVAWQHNFNEFQIFGVRYFPMPNARGLVHAGAGLQLVLALTFVLKNRPSFEHIHNLQREIVQMPFARRVGIFSGANHMHDRRILCRLSYAQIAVFKVLAQPIKFKTTFRGVLDAE